MEGEGQGECSEILQEGVDTVGRGVRDKDRRKNPIEGLWVGCLLSHTRLLNLPSLNASWEPGAGPGLQRGKGTMLSEHSISGGS